MSQQAHPGAMQPEKPGSTRTAAATMPANFPTGGRYLSYIAFGATSFVYIAASLSVLRAVLALGAGETAWNSLLADHAGPGDLLVHGFMLLVLLWAGWRFLIVLSAKANPPMMGPIRRPPLAVFPPMMGALWLGASVVAIVVLWGIFP